MSEAETQNDDASTETTEAPTGEQEIASFRANGAKLRSMIQQASIGNNGAGLFAELYLNIRNGVLHVVGTDSTATTFAYCTFGEPYLDDVTVSDSMSGENGDMQAVVKVEPFLTYLGLVGDDGLVDIRFFGGEDAEYANQIEITGNLNARFFIPSGGLDVPFELVERFNDDEEFEMADGDTLSTSIWTDTQQFNRLIDAVEMDDSLRYFPLNVENGNLTINTTGDDRRDSVWGDLQGEVDGPNVSGAYKKGFNEVFSTLSGDVTASFNGEGSPLCVVQNNVDGRTMRYVLGPSNQ